MTDAPTRSPRWMRIALIASLAVNLLVLGLFVGSHLDPDRGPRGEFRTGDLRALAYALPKDTRDDLRKRLDARRPDFRANRAKFSEQRARLIAVLEADPLDVGALGEVFAVQRQTITAAAETGHGILMDAIAQMSADERRAFAQTLQTKRHGPKDR